MNSNAEASARAGGDARAIQEMLLFVVRSLADHPDDVAVALISGEEGDVFEVQVHVADIGRIIGKNGQTVRALHAIVNANAMKSGRRFHVDIVEAGEDLNQS